MKIAAQASPADIDAAVSAAKAAFDFGPWPRVTPGILKASPETSLDALLLGEISLRPVFLKVWLGRDFGAAGLSAYLELKGINL